MRSARCVFKGFRREGGHQPSRFCGLPGKSHLCAAIILTLCCWKDLENGQTELAITGGEKKTVLVMLFFFPPLHHVSVSVSGSLINLCFDSDSFLFPKCSRCGLWSCQFSPNCLLLGVSPFVFYLSLIYAKPCTGGVAWCLLQWKPSLGFLCSTKLHKYSQWWWTSSDPLRCCSVRYLLDPRLQVCDTGGVTSVVCVTQ